VKDTESNSSKSLQQLTHAVKEVIDAGLSKGIVRPEREVFVKWKVDEFNHNDKVGPVSFPHISSAILRIEFLGR